MTFLYISGVGADSTEKSSVMWERVRGRTENALLKLPFKKVFIFRPSVVEPKGGVISKTPSYRLFYNVIKPLFPLVKNLFPSHISSTENIGRAAIAVSKYGYSKNILFSSDFNSLSLKG